ncbi:MAG: hypothetical protein WAO98_04125 [Alphaproteobacteria bacterium]
MTFQPKPFFQLLPLLLMLPSIVLAQGDGKLHVTRPVIHAEQDKPEMCLEFDHGLEDDKSTLNLKLEANGKSIASVQQNLNIAGTLLCIPNLEHQRTYRLSITAIRGSDGEKLAEPYRLSFTIPDRQPSLAFANDGLSDGITRWKDNDPLLRAINAKKVKIELYRISEPQKMVEAWRQRMQTSLAPSESAYFARHNGKLLWQSDLVMGDIPNKNIEQKIPLHAAIKDLQPGFYLITATAYQTEASPREKSFAPLAAMWLLRSELQISAIRGHESFYGLAQKWGAAEPLKNVQLSLYDQNQNILLEGKTGDNGLWQANLSSEKKSNATTLFGLSEQGDVHFSDVSKVSNAVYTRSGFDAVIATDKAFYAPHATVNIVLGAHDARGHAVFFDNSRLQVLRPDRSVYSSHVVTKEQDGKISFTAPVGSGFWPLVWVQNDGRLLAETPLHLSAHTDASHFQISADRSLLGDDGAVTVTLKSLDKNGKPLPYIAGQIAAAWTTPERIFPGWNDFHFSANRADEAPPTPLMGFITDAQGESQLHLNLALPSDRTKLHMAALYVQGDAATGSGNPPPLTLPLRPKDYVIGIAPRATEGKFTENSLAHFDIIALDADGKKRDVEDLNYQISEEGRSFDWYQAEGRWDYKAQQQKRRIGKGALSIRADGTGLDWPVTSGTYRLEIFDANRTLRAQYSFSAGWGATQTNAEETTTPLKVTASSAKLAAGKDVEIRFHLDQPSMVTAIIADDHIRQVMYQAKNAGDHSISFAPQEDWGDVLVTIKTPFAMGQISLPFKTVDKDRIEKLAVPETSQGLTIQGDVLPTLYKGESAQLPFTFKNNGTIAGTYRYSFTSTAGIKLSNTSGTITLNPGQSRTLTLGLTALDIANSEVRLELLGPRNLRINRNWPLAISLRDVVLATTASQTLDAQQNWQQPEMGKDRTKESDYLFIAPEPMFDLPQILSATLHVRPFSTRALADDLIVLRLWRNMITHADILNTQEIALRQNNDVMRLLARQKADGSFPAMPGADGDLATTALVITALSPLEQPVVKIALDQASDWLKHRLDNSWFDEKERPERAGAYAALAAANRLDISNLHYFADTSKDKNLPSLAAVQLASAFARINDKDRSALWIAQAQLEKNADLASELLPYVAESNVFETRDLLPALQKISAEKIKKTATNIAVASAFLQTMWYVQNNAGQWRVSINKGEQNTKGILTVNLQNKNGSVDVHNSSDRQLYLMTAREFIRSDNDNGITQRFYRMNGSSLSADDALKRGEVYLMESEGNWPEGDASASLLVSYDAAPALQPVSCALSPTLAVNESLAWISALTLSPFTSCEESGGKVDVLLQRKEGSGGAWRSAVLVKAVRSGSFRASGVQTRNLSGKQELNQGRAFTLRIND